MNKRYKPEVRKEEITSKALELAELTHYKQVQRKQVADALGVTPPALTYHFGTMPQLRRAIMRAAIQNGNAVVVSQGLAAGDDQAKKAPEELRAQAVEVLMAQVAYE